MTELQKIPTEDISLYEAQKKIYPREVKGRYQRIRFWVIASVWVAFYGLAWITWDGRQAVLFDLPARQFHIFGLTFWPQDFYLLTWLLVLGALSLFLVTAVAGRVWCGYTCPQTVWTEAFLFMERLTEGSHRKRIKLDNGPWTLEKILRKTAKQVLWVTFALWTGFTFVGYFTPIRELGAGVMTFDLGTWEWFWFLFYSFATYGNAGFLREQVCQYMCPYARFQGAMLDRKTVTVSYDAMRGEPRRGTSAADATGDCINCTLCVQVCPTGIDIRDGSQYECIGCTACIDACDEVMDKMNKPRGLVGYASFDQLAVPLEERPHINAADNNGLFKKSFWSLILRPRIMLYIGLWVVLTGSFIAFISLRSAVAFDIIRDRNAFFQIAKTGFVDNVYTLKIMNKHQKPLAVDLKLEEYPDAELIYQEDELKHLPANQMTDLPVRVRLPDSESTGKPEKIHFVITNLETGKEIDERTLFWRPRPSK